MPTFIEKSCCKGSRPSGIVDLHHVLRPDITGVLLRERNAPRFLVAPTGYGKSSCAYEYAQVVFGFEHVFWIRCDSPCFLRDLDAGSIVAQISSVDPSAQLVIFDDVPRLDPERTESFDDLLRELANLGIETIVACVPSVDTVSSKHTEKTLLSAADLATTDDEVEMERMRGNLSRDAADGLTTPKRAACLLWGNGGVELILKGLRAEELPGDLELMVLCMLVLGDGRIDELGEVLPPASIEEDAAYLASMFPYLGIDLDSGTFATISVAPADILSQAKFLPNALGRASLQEERDALAKKLADMVLAKGDGNRAAGVLEALGTKAAAANWIACHGWELLDQGWPLPVDRLAAGGRAADAEVKGPLLALRSWALAMLGDDSECVRMGSRIMRLSSARWCDVAAAAFSRCLLGQGEHREAVDAGIARAKAMREIACEEGDAAAITEREGSFDWGALLDLESLRREDGAPASYGERFHSEILRLGGLAPGRAKDALRNALFVSGSWCLADFARQKTALLAIGSDEADSSSVDLAIPIVQLLSSELASIDRSRSITWPECVAVDALQTMDDLYPYAFDGHVSPRLVATARNMAVRVMAQADQHRRELSAEEEAKGEYELTHEDAFRAHQQPASKIASLRVATPSLVIALFGGAEVWVGTDGFDSRQIKRKNAKIALAMLAMNRGREITKDKLASTLWPEAPIDNARQNLYVVWAYLKKLLKVGSSCPYLISTQTGYKLDSRFVITDIQRFDELCRDLLFGREDKEIWEELYEKVSGDFSEDFLPEITDNAYIESLRRRLRTQLVDGLIEASSRMGREGENRGAIWFAREALRRDHSREDGYIALMEAQIASNQRGAALDTYFECRRYLSEELGIDPSRKVVDLYRSVIETEEEF